MCGKELFEETNDGVIFKVVRVSGWIVGGKRSRARRIRGFGKKTSQAVSMVMVVG